MPVAPECFHGREADREPRRACRKGRDDIAEIVRTEVNATKTHRENDHENERNGNCARPPGLHNENEEHTEQAVKQSCHHGVTARKAVPQQIDIAPARTGSGKRHFKRQIKKDAARHDERQCQ